MLLHYSQSNHAECYQELPLSSYICSDMTTLVFIECIYCVMAMFHSIYNNYNMNAVLFDILTNDRSENLDRNNVVVIGLLILT